jgi:hypothetical protein
MEIVFNLIGFNLDPADLRQSAFLTPDRAMLWLTPEDTCWKNRTNLVMVIGIGPGHRGNDWRAR